MTREEEITKFMVDTLLEEGYEDNAENRLAFLLGLQKAWNEDEDILEPEVALERTFYKLALSSMIFGLRLRIMFPRIMA